MTKIMIKGSEFLQALGMREMEIDDLVVELPGYAPVDYSRDWDRDDDEIWETCGLCEESIAIAERLAGKPCFEMTRGEWDRYSPQAHRIEFNRRRGLDQLAA